MNVGIIGCGLIGKKRALALENDDVLIACCDTNIELGQKFADDFNCIFYKDYTDLLNSCDTIVVAVVNKYAKDIVKSALDQNKNILVEKPMGRDFKESLEILLSSKDKILKVGFNHRFHPAIWKAKELFDAGTIGKLMYIRGTYGHGGRPGMESEWRASKDLCGGGELLDQGVHLIDLSRWFAGNITSVFGKVSTKFWDIKVEDTAFMLLQTESGIDIQLNVSWTNWKNIFQFELFGTDGYLKINGLGGWYGTETLEIGIRKQEGGVPDVEKIEYQEDTSWTKEWQEFKAAIKVNRLPIGNGIDGGKANQIIDALYKSSEKNKIIEIK